MNKFINILKNVKNYKNPNIRLMHDRILPSVKPFKKKIKIIGEKSPRLPNYNMGKNKNIKNNEKKK